ncbi:MAG: DNA-processing protein DprA [Acidimicrobiia bacterium]
MSLGTRATPSGQSPSARPDDRRVAAAALACLPGIGPATLRRLLLRFPDPTLAAEAILAGRALELLEQPGRGAGGVERARSLAASWAGAINLDFTRAILERRSATVLLASDPDFPIEVDLPGCPSVLFQEGERPEALEAPRVAIVGTRAATPAGLADAAELGAFLAQSGITVVSGLAIGIDGSAHTGALDAGGLAIGVVATGLDVVYPRRHVNLHARVRQGGVLIGENGFGVGPHPSRFPVRNRVLAALSDVVVVVEATLSGGARITAGRALEYGRPLLALPGSRRNPSAAGCNALLADGAHPLLEPSDVLVALGITPGSRRRWVAPKTATPSGVPRRVEAALAGEPASDDELARRCDLSLGEIALAVGALERAGRVERARGLVWPL